MSARDRPRGDDEPDRAAPRGSFRLVAALAVPFGLYAWAEVLATGLGHDGVIGPKANALGTDWMIYYAVARAVLAGDPALVYDGTRLTAAVNADFVGQLSSPLPYHAFLYSPAALLLLLPFALLPFLPSYALGQVLSFAGLATALRDRLLVGAALLSPAAANNVVSGQNGFLTAALLVGGVGLVERAPWTGGALLGLLSYKPQCALMVPVALVAARQWRALGAAAASAAGLAGAALLLLGPGLWRRWIGLALAPPSDVSQTWRDWGRLWDDSVYTCATLLGAPDAVANGAQILAILLAAALTWLAFRRDLAADLRLAVLLAASAVAAPHVSSYDLVLLAPAATIVVRRRLEEGARPLALLLPLALWLAPLFNPPRNVPLGLLTPLMIFALIIGLVARAAPIEDRLPS